MWCLFPGVSEDFRKGFEGDQGPVVVGRDRVIGKIGVGVAVAVAKGEDGNSGFAGFGGGDF